MASTNEWFETVAEARRRARRRLPRSVFLALEAGSEKGTTLRDNVAAFSELGLAPPRIADRPAARSTATSVLGQDISLPVIASPTGVQAVHPEGEVAVARGAAEAGTALGLSAFASVAVEDAVAANPKTFFQLFWIGDRESNLARMQRARDAGAKALIVTLDWSFATARDWGSPPIPETMNLQTMLRFAPEGLTRPGYVLSWLRHGRLPELTVPNMSTPGEPAPSFFGAYGEWMQTAPPSWADIAWLRGQWDGPFMVKGVMRPEDARRAADSGVDAVIVSNHGGRQLDGCVASLDALEPVVDAVGDRIEVLMDGGVRRGTDVLKAVALGARGVLLGRSVQWALAAGGEAGIVRLFEILTGELRSAMALCGCARMDDATGDIIRRTARHPIEPV